MLWGFLKIGKKPYKLIFEVGSTNDLPFLGCRCWKKRINGSKAYDPHELTIDQLTFWDIGIFFPWRPNYNFMTSKGSNPIFAPPASFKV